ncbi:MAG TPA: tetratricopeptide repeat protein, partial [Blastocatellia bacterium]
GYWQNTTSLFDHASAVTENNYVALTYLAREMQRSGKPEAAIEDLTRAVETEPSYEMAQFTLGALLADSGRFGEAVGHLQLVARMEPGSADANARLGAALAGSGDLNGASYYLQRALEIDPSYAPGLVGAADVFARQDRLSDAIAYYLRALDVIDDMIGRNPNRDRAAGLEADVDCRLATVMAKAGNQADAAAYFKKALELVPAYPKATDGLRSLSQESEERP